MSSPETLRHLEETAMTYSYLSGIEKQFWTASKMHPESPAYNIGACVKIAGVLDKEHLRRAWDIVFNNADVFKKYFLEKNGIPSSFINNMIDAPWQEISCGEDELLNIVDSIFHRPFRIDAAPLVRLLLVEIDNNCHYLILVMHHIITDLHSKLKISGSISALYNGTIKSLDFEPYSSFIKAEADYLRSKKGKNSLSYWENKMSNGPAALDLPHAKERAPIFRAKGSSVEWNPPVQLNDLLIKKETSNKGQVFLCLLTAYIAFLGRLSGQKRFSVGVPLTNRRIEGSGNTLGAFVNILPVCVNISHEESFSSLYDKVRKEMLLNHRNQEVPFIDIAGYYKGKREPSRPYLIQAGFTMEPLFELELDGLSCKSIPIKKRGSQMDLFFTYWPSENGFSGYWEYNSDLLNETLVKDWQDCFNTLVKQYLERPDASLTSCQILSPVMKKRHLIWNTTIKSYSLDQTLAVKLRETFYDHRKDVALISEDRQFSYAEMESIVCRTASMLHQTFGERKRIALLLSQSPEMVFAIHSIIQSGNIYVPLGTDWPQERIRIVLEDVDPVAVITEKKYHDLVSSLNIPVMFPESQADEKAQKITYPDLAIGPEDSAYIIYTSGSTGKPKGAELPHNGVLNRILWMQDEYQLTPQDRVLQKTPYTFDVSVWEFLWPFFTGACLVVTKPGGNKDPHYLKKIIEDEKISILHFVPSMLSIFLSVPGISELTSIRDVICSGEALTKKQEETFFNTFDKARLHNLYGPTEASIDVTYWECGKDSEKGSSVVPIGQPIANTQLYIMDQNNNLCPPYVTGELLIGGIGLARRYWNRPELTKEKFIPNPFGSGRLYRTGDLARYRMDGVIEYLGRTDFQVKLRGLRVELGEIEKAMESHPAVEKAVVHLWQRTETDERLVAYLTPLGQDKPPSQDKMTSFLRKTLPDYMIPAHFIALFEMPLNANGKLDRKALPAPKIDSVNRSVFPPENEIQIIIHDLWKELLSTRQFGIDDNFFDVGGSSLKIIELGLMLEKAFGMRVEVVDLFRYPTIKGMATLISQKPAADNSIQEKRAKAQRKRRRAMVDRYRLKKGR